MSKEKLNGTLDLYKSIAHCNLSDGSCCGIFMVVQDGDVICNECNKSLIDVVTEIDDRARLAPPEPEVSQENIDALDKMGLCLHVECPSCGEGVNFGRSEGCKFNKDEVLTFAGCCHNCNTFMDAAEKGLTMYLASV